MEHEAEGATRPLNIMRPMPEAVCGSKRISKARRRLVESMRWTCGVIVANALGCGAD